MAKARTVSDLSAASDLQEALRRLIAARLKDLLDLLPGAGPLGDPPADLIHDVRVATRRLRAVLSLYPFRPRGARRAAREQIKELGRALGQVRDYDVNLSWLRARSEGDLDAGQRPSVDRLKELLTAERAAALLSLASAIERFRAEGEPLVKDVAGSLRAGGKLGGGAVRRRLARRRDGVRAWLPRVLDTDGAPDLLHQLRIEAKKLRYHAEPLEDAAPRARRLLKALPEVQEVLGQVHEEDARERWLQERLVAAPEPEWPGLVALLKRTRDERAERWARGPQVLRRFADRAL